MSERWFSPASYGPTGGIVTQALSIIGIAVIGALVHASLTPDEKVWVDPYAGFSQMQPSGPAVQQSEPPADAGASDTPAETVEVAPPEVATPEFKPRLTSEESFAIYDVNGADFLDARPQEDYEAGHILGAFNVPYENAAARVAQLVGEGWISPARRVVVYCIGGQCTESDFVVRALLQSGFDPSMVHIDTGGYPAWESAGHPTEAGADMTEMP